MSYKLGSLFDGSGGFPLSGTLCDIEPMWAAEIEPYPIAVTTSRFPNMKHLGDISKVNGAKIEPVDIITFGSPCQDLSVAGKRAGLKHEENGDDETTRSGLFMEAVRIIKEMRKATNDRYPRFAVWENVPGAFSSNNGEDFRIVLQELIKIAEPNAVMPEVPKKGWAYADRVFDAQYWGVPQRRRRIYLVADFRGECAEKILFERKGLRGYFEKSGTQGQTVTPNAQGSTGADDREGALPYTLKIRSGCEGGDKGALVQEDLSATLATNNDQYLFQPIGYNGYNATETGHNGVVYAVDQGGGKSQANVTEELSPTLTCTHGGEPAVAYGVDVYNQSLTGDKAKTLNSVASDADHIPCTIYSIENHPNDSRVKIDNEGKVQALTSRMGTGGGNVPMVMEERPSVINLNKDDVQSKTILDPSGIAPALYAGECRGGGGECYVMEAFCKSRRAKSADDATTWKHAKVANTLNTFDQGEARANEIIVMATQQGGAEICKDLCPTITAAAGMSGNNQPVTVYAIDQQGGKGSANYAENVMPTLCSDSHGTPNRVAYSLTTGDYMQVNEEKTATLLARDYKDPTCVEFYDETSRSYIVRRLTPTECARLQGFPDKWGHIEPKTELTDDEYRFWLEVRKTHDAINGRAVKDYNEKQMLTYYNKLWTDSAEYKMWGNGIALPCALYVMQGIKDAFVDEQTARSKWLDELLRS